MRPEEVDTEVSSRRGRDRIPHFYTVDPNPVQDVAKTIVEVKYDISPYVKTIVLKYAISKNEDCPISSEELTEENAEVTSCGHVFTKESIQRWLSESSSRGLCPICKQKCS